MMDCPIDSGSFLETTLKMLPARPGVYVMKDKAGNVIYVGKAVNLRHRVRSYFQRGAGANSFKIRELVRHVAQVETIITATELEALILECNLIKQHRPKFNIRLKDDKNYLYVKIDVQSPWPRVYTTRRVLNDGARYFGPYSSSRSLHATLDVLKKIFPYRSCDLDIPASPGEQRVGDKGKVSGRPLRPCLDYHIHRCLGPCIGATTQEEYAQVIQEVILFLEGKSDRVVEMVRARMEAAAEQLDFERAALYRDQLQAIQQVIERQRVISTAGGDQDVIAFARDDGQACVQVFFIRGGKLIGRDHFVLQGTAGSDDREVMAGFLQQFYDTAPYVPPEIVLQIEAEEMTILEAWLRSKRGNGVTLIVPRNGEQKDLVNMVAENAAETLAMLRAQWLADARKTSGALVELQEALNLPTMPRRIECYDISNIAGTAAVGSMVVFEQGVPKNGEYRRFKIKTVAGIDDYAMLQEVLRRRFKRLAEAATVAGETADAVQASAWLQRPDLVVVDGGKGQLSAARRVMAELGLDDIPTVGLAKEQEEVFLPDRSEPVLLPRTSQALYLLQRLRDEAHRFALAYHQRLRQAQGLRSVLDEVPGIGPRRKAALLQRFGTVEGIRAASVEELASVKGMTRSLAERLKEYL